MVLAWAAAFCIFCSVEVQAGSLSFAWNPSPSPEVVGYKIHYGTRSGIYAYNVDVGTNTTAVVKALTVGQTYYFTVTAYSATAQSADSTVITNTAAAPPGILAQPMAQSAVIGSPLVLSVDVASVTPVSFQWFFDGSAIEGATNSVLILPEVSESSAGSYKVVVSNAAGSVTSQVAYVTILDPASSANGGAPAMSAIQPGVYNGLFNQTNSTGNSIVTEIATGFLSKWTIGPSGAYSSQVALGGQTFAISGVFTGKEINTIVDRSHVGFSNLNLTLYATTALGTNRLTGVVSNMNASNPWVALLTATLGASAFPQTEDFVFLSPPPPGQAPGNWACVLAVSTSGLVSLVGFLGDGTTISQSTTLGADGSFPVYQSLYSHTGLLAGWVTLAGGSPVGNLTWIQPGNGTRSNPGFTNIISFGTGLGLSTNSFQPIVY